MKNVIIPIIDRVDEYNKSISAISRNKNVTIIVGTTRALFESLVLPKSAKVKLFKEGSQKEEIINSLQDMIGDGEILVCRRPFSEQEFERIDKSQTQVTYLATKKKDTFMDFVMRAFSSLVKFLFGVDFFEGDISLICFDKDLSQVLKSVSNLSYATRVDRWRGVEQSSVEADLPPVVLENDNTHNLMLLIFAALSFCVPLAITIVVCCLCEISFVIGMILFCICLLGACGAILLVCTYFFNRKIGKRMFKKAEID